MKQRLLLAVSLATLLMGAGVPPSSPAKPLTETRTETPTYTRDIAPLLYKNCVTCHRAGEIGPFSLMRYEDARSRARMLAAVVEKRIMPPWKPEAGYGPHLTGDRRLTPDQIALLARWAANGAPRGRLTDLPAPPMFPTGWRLGKPDLILTMPASFTIPAEGNDIYQHFVFPLNLTRDRYVRGIEVRPGNLRVAHHAIGLLDGSGKARQLDAKTPEMGYGGMGGAGFTPSGLTPGYVPGQTIRFFDQGTALTFRKGTDFVLQMHYHPTGKVETDRTQVGLYFTDKKPDHNPTGILLGSENINIPAGVSSYVVRDDFTLPADLRVTTLWAHMHLIGKKIRVWAELPDGSVRPLLKISDWDFNWQDTYRYEVPVSLPKGTVLRSEFTFDNSAQNPRNPNSPPRRITLGENSTDEMAGLWIGGLTDDWRGELALLAANVGHFVQINARGVKPWFGPSKIPPKKDERPSVSR